MSLLKLFKPKGDNPSESSEGPTTFEGQFRGKDPVSRISEYPLDENTVAYVITGPNMPGLPHMIHIEEAIQRGIVTLTKDEEHGGSVISHRGGIGASAVWIPQGYGFASPNTGGTHQQSRVAETQGYVILPGKFKSMGDLSCVAPTASFLTDSFSEKGVKPQIIAVPPSLLEAKLYGSELTFQRDAVMAAFGLNVKDISNDDLGALLRSDAVVYAAETYLNGLNQILRSSSFPGVHGVTGIVTITAVPGQDGQTHFILVYDQMGSKGLVKSLPVATQAGITSQLVRTGKIGASSKSTYQLMNQLGGIEFIEQIVRATLSTPFEGRPDFIQYLEDKATNVNFRGLRVHPYPIELERNLVPGQSHTRIK